MNWYTCKYGDIGQRYFSFWNEKSGKVYIKDKQNGEWKSHSDKYIAQEIDKYARQGLWIKITEEEAALMM